MNVMKHFHDVVHIVRQLRQSRQIRLFDRKQMKMRSTGPDTIQIQTIDRCNASCVMCPYSYEEKDGPPSLMDDALYEKILKEIADTGALTGFTPMLQNEPLLDRGLANRIRLAKEILGRKMWVELATNGSALTDTRIDELIDSGLDSLHISIDAATEETYRKIRKGLDYSTVVRNVENLLRRHSGVRVVVRFLQQKDNQGEEAAFAQMWKKRGATVAFLSIVNRAGTLKDYELMRTKLPRFYRRWVQNGLNHLCKCCPLPFTAMNILHDGCAILCCHDWSTDFIIGDLSKQSLEGIWNGKEINRCRELLISGRYKSIPICKDCSLADKFGRHSV